MKNTQDQHADAFSEQEMEILHSQLKKTAASTAVSMTIGIGSVDGFAAAALGIDAPGINFKGDAVIVRRFLDAGKPIQFGVLSLPDYQPYGPEPLYATIYEAMLYADIYLQRMVQSLKELHANRQADQHKSLPTFDNNVIRSAVVTPSEVQFVQQFANDLGKCCGMQGFANFVESGIGILSIAIGIIHKSRPILLGTVVAAAECDGNTCSVRDLMNNPMPGPAYYTTVNAALLATRPYFISFAVMVTKELRPSLMQRLFGR
ncbi:MAG: hypothetical protein IPF38_01930 [Burkholderiales bacterium]|uniref:hypothetical protein n=1 Tax=Candidatus Aalborgicola defluviihabitans TaxID=3386187 RepID=UPI001D5D36F4|nr:hypothetical protein [Burkholderiales bacterium]MBK6568219.1 hypothetical protein [Burkholderiales bacterium]